MKHFAPVVPVVLLFLLGSVITPPAANCLPTIYSTISNATVNGGKYTVEIWDVASDNVFVTNINFAFTVNTSALDTNSIVVTGAGRYAAFTYEWHSVSSTQITILLTGAAVRPTTLYGGEKTITITMNIKDPAATSNFSWPRYGTPAYSYNQGFVGFSFQVFQGGDNLPLPITLGSFNVNAVNGHAALEWSTVSEINNYGFYVEKSADNHTWSSVAFIEGHGTTLSRQTYAYTDVQPSTYYRLKQVDVNGDAHYSEILRLDLPTKFDLSQNYPNPFNPTTNIKYALASASEVRLSIHDMLGREVATIVNGRDQAGVHEVRFDASGLSSGTYFYRLQAGGATQTRQFLLLK